MSVAKAAEDEERVRRQLEAKRRRQHQHQHQRSSSNSTQREFHVMRSAQTHSPSQSTSTTGAGGGGGSRFFTPEMLSPEETEELVKSILHRSAVANVAISMSDHEQFSHDSSSFSHGDNHSHRLPPPPSHYQHRYSSSAASHSKQSVDEEGEAEGDVHSESSQYSVTVQKTLEGREKIMRLMEKFDSLGGR
jgi:hypothetical protein